MTNTTPVEEYNKFRDDWALAIGRFLVAFTSCEFWTYLYVKSFGSERLREAVGDMNLAPRAELARALVSDLGLTEAVQARVDAAFKKLTHLATPRNIVAHNGPMIHIYKDANTGDIEVRHELRSARDPAKDITIARLEKLQAEAVELDEELALLFGEVRKPESQVANGIPAGSV